MVKTLIHIGYHKTGSTFLQRRIFKHHPRIHVVNRKELKRVFLRVGSLHFDAAGAGEWIAAQRRTAESGRDSMVISDEELSGNIHTGGNGGYLPKEVADRLHTVLPDAQVAIFIRNQYDIIESVYRQYVKKGGTLGIKKYLFDQGGLNHRFPLFSFDHFEYHPLIAYYIALFGRERVHVFLNEEMKNDIDAFLADFFARTSIPPADGASRKERKWANVRMSFASIFLARLTNRFYGSDPINRRVIVHIPGFYKICRAVYRGIDRLSIVRSIDRKRSFLSDALRDRITERYASSNRKLASLINVDLSDHGYP